MLRTFFFAGLTLEIPNYFDHGQLAINGITTSKQSIAIRFAFRAMRAIYKLLFDSMVSKHK